MEKRIVNQKLIYVDCDDTLIMWDFSSHTALERVWVECYDQESEVHVNQKNKNLVEKFHKLGYGIIVWSATGSDWAEAVAKAIGIDQLVTAYLTKPRFYLDDLDSSVWMGPRLYRDPMSTGSSYVKEQTNENK